MITITVYKNISKHFLLLIYHGYDRTENVPGMYFFAYVERHESQALVLLLIALFV